MALGDLRILDLSRLLPGPFCTMLLGDMGADVIKVEDPTAGDYLRAWPPLRDGEGAMYAALNRNKRSLVLDLKQAAGRDAFLTLVAGSDVVVESFRPGVMDKLEVGYAELRERNPGIILCSISGYGQDGPYRDRAGHDLNYIGLAGILDAESPKVPAVQIGDIGGGALMATVAILAALHARDRDGEGQHIDISMLDGLLAWQTAAVARVLTASVPGEGDVLTGRYPCYAVYPCADGHLTVAALEPKFWTNLVAAIDAPHLQDCAFSSGDEGAATRGELETIFARRTRAEWRRHFDRLDVCVEPVNSLEESLDDLQVRARGILIDAATTGGAAQIGFPLRFSGTPAAWRRTSPQHGEHSRQILQAAGYDDAAIATLIKDGVTR